VVGAVPARLVTHVSSRDAGTDHLRAFVDDQNGSGRATPERLHGSPFSSSRPTV